MEEKRINEMKKEYSIGSILKTTYKAHIAIALIILFTYLGTRNLEVTGFVAVVLIVCDLASLIRLLLTHFQVKRKKAE